MIPFCRTIDEADKVIAAMEENGVSRLNDETLKIYMMVEIPSNVLLGEEFAQRFDGFLNWFK
jgi:pyruvate,water dikinase